MLRGLFGHSISYRILFSFNVIKSHRCELEGQRMNLPKRLIVGSYDFDQLNETEVLCVSDALDLVDHEL